MEGKAFHQGWGTLLSPLCDSAEAQLRLDTLRILRTVFS
jgi:hypothetical protein